MTHNVPAGDQPSGDQPPAQGHRPGSVMRLSDLASNHPDHLLDRVLQWIPRVLSSKPHVILLTMLGVYLVVLPLFGVMVSAKSELIGGNYTNVTSDIGACIAAGGTLHLINQGRKRMKADAERLKLLQDIHALLHHVHSDASSDLGRAVAVPVDALTRQLTMDQMQDEDIDKF
jgi:hypothetical protein